MRRLAAGFFLFLILVLGGTWMYRRFMRAPQRPSLWQNIPADYLLVAYTPSFSQMWRAIQHSPLSDDLNQSPHLASLASLGQAWDSLLHADADIQNWLAGHALLIATYPEGTLYLIDAPFLARIGDWRGEMQRLAQLHAWKVETIDAGGGYGLWKLRKGYLAPAGEILAYSTQPQLLTRFLSGERVAELPEEWGKALLEEQGAFLLLTTGKALQRLLDHPLLNALYALDTLQMELRFTEEGLILKGRALASAPIWRHLAQTSPSLADLCPPSTTALFMLRVGVFDSLFHAHLYPQHRVEIREAEKNLRLSYADFFSRLAGEVGLVYGTELYLLYRLWTGDKLSIFPQDKVLSYRGYSIHQVRVGGLFRWLYGEAFKGWERPYLMQVGEWLLFARNPGPLREWIDAFLSRQSLYSRSDFPGFSVEKVLVGGYLDCQRPSWLEGWLAPSATDRWQQELHPFHQIYLTLSRSDSLHVKIELRALWRAEDKSQQRSDTLGKSIQVLAEIEKDTMTDGPQEEYYPNGVVKRRYTLIDSQMEGEYVEYFPNGLIKVQGFYEQGQKVGRWRYFSPKGELLREEVWGGEVESKSNSNGP
ncbi:MAG: hypothetical protein N3E49_02075 [Bacteroidia bacterium]|nr:hypothetical protein [Bacteroidia bacterium]